MKFYVQLIGRFGNQLFIYSFARSFCESIGATLCAPPWIGEKIFDIPHADRTPSENCDELIGGYRQNQESLIYTREDCKRWFKFKPHIKEQLDEIVPDYENVFHLRRGDFGSLGYPVISLKSYCDAAKKFGLESDGITVCSEEHPSIDERISGDLEFLIDFYRMMKSNHLFRANSSFSWWAATLGCGKVYSPVIDGIAGGEKEVECEFVSGNWPRLSNLENITDLHLCEK